MAYSTQDNMMARLMMTGGGNAIAGLNQIKQQNQMRKMMNQANLTSGQQTNQFNAAMNPMRIAQAKQQAQRQGMGQLRQGNDGRWYQEKIGPGGQISMVPVQQAQPGAAQSGRGVPGSTPFNPAAMEVFGGPGQPQGAPQVPAQQPAGGFNQARGLKVPTYLQKFVDPVKMGNNTVTKEDLDTAFQTFKSDPDKYASGGMASAKTEFLPGGITRMAMPDGSVQYKRHGVKIDDPEKIASMLAESRQTEATQKGLIAGTQEASKQAVKFSGDFYKRIEPVNKAIDNMAEGIRQLDAGANTGAITSMFPSFKAATVELMNVQNQMGLDVIGTTTFGALSESELEFALKTALPTDLNPQKLKAWLQRKMAAQGKLRDYLGEAAMYLGTPGNTVGSWIKEQKKRQEIRNMSPEERAAYAAKLRAESG